MNDTPIFTCAECGKCCTDLRKPARADARKVMEDVQGRGGYYYVPSTARISPWLFEWEVERLFIEAAQLKIDFRVRPHHIYVDRRLTQPIVMEWAMDFNDCPFLRDGRCSIYGRHPLVCRQYPFLGLNTLSHGCPEVIHIPPGLDGEQLERWLDDTYRVVYQNSLHFHLVLRHNYKLVGLLIRDGLLKPADDWSLKAVNRLVQRAGTIGLYEYLVENGVMSEGEYSRQSLLLNTSKGVLELLKSMDSR